MLKVEVLILHFHSWSVKEVNSSDTAKPLKT